MQLQQTLIKTYTFEGKGLHSGKNARMAVSPAPIDTGIRFIRTDIGADAYVDALAENVSNTARSTTISNGEVSVSTIEHLLSALTGMGVDNAIVEIDNVEVPILSEAQNLILTRYGMTDSSSRKLPGNILNLRRPLR